MGNMYMPCLLQLQRLRMAASRSIHSTFRSETGTSTGKPCLTREWRGKGAAIHRPECSRPQIVWVLLAELLRLVARVADGTNVGGLVGHLAPCVQEAGGLWVLGLQLCHDRRFLKGLADALHIARELHAAQVRLSNTWEGYSRNIEHEQEHVHG
eukprot:170375-Pelagomonas_calceolata.AAC.1